MNKTFAFLLFFALSLPLHSQQLMKSVTWENIKAHPAALPVIGEIHPVASSLDAQSVWSVGVETMDRDYAIFNEFRSFVGQTGVGYARLQSGWAKTEQKKGKYDFAWLDEHVDGLIPKGCIPGCASAMATPSIPGTGTTSTLSFSPTGR